MCSNRPAFIIRHCAQIDVMILVVKNYLSVSISAEKYNKSLRLLQIKIAINSHAVAMNRCGTLPLYEFF